MRRFRMDPPEPTIAAPCPDICTNGLVFDLVTDHIVTINPCPTCDGSGDVVVDLEDDRGVYA